MILICFFIFIIQQQENIRDYENELISFELNHANLSLNSYSTFTESISNSKLSNKKRKWLRLRKENNLTFDGFFSIKDSTFCANYYSVLNMPTPNFAYALFKENETYFTALERLFLLKKLALLFRDSNKINKSYLNILKKLNRLYLNENLNRNFILRELYYYYSENLKLEVIIPFYSFLLKSIKIDSDEDIYFKNDIIRSRMYLDYFHTDYKILESTELIDTSLVRPYNKVLFDLFSLKKKNSLEINSLNVGHNVFSNFLYLERDLKLNPKLLNKKKLLFSLDSIESNLPERLKKILGRKIGFDCLRLASLTFKSSIEECDSIYIRLKNNLIKRFKQNTELLSKDFYPYYAYSISLYLQKKAKINPVYVLKEFLFWEKIFFDTRINAKRNFELNPNFYKNEVNFFSAMDRGEQNLETFLNHALFYESSTFNKINITQENDFLDFVSNLSHLTIVIPFKTLNGSFILTISNGKINSFSFSALKEFYNSIAGNKELIVIDNQSVFNGAFEVEYFNLFNHVPNVRYLSNLYEISTNNNKYDIKSIHFLGADKKFNYKDSIFSELYYPKSEIDIFRTRLDVTDTFNECNPEVSWEKDIVHISSHFITDHHHPSFNKIVTGLNKDGSPTFLTGYSAENISIDTKLVVLNACHSGDFKSYDMLGVKHFGRFLSASGAKSILLTTNEIDDRTASLLIQKFYEKVLEGKTLSLSLNLAKEYILKNINPNPDFWNAFQLYGENASFKVESTIKYYLFLVCLILIVTFFFLKRLRIKREFKEMPHEN